MKTIYRKQNTLKDRFRKPVTLTGRHYKIARRMLIETTEILNHNHINYFFDAGGLLGCIRSGDLLPWDNDLDMLLPSNQFNNFCSIIPKLKQKNWRVYLYKMAEDGPGWKKGDAKGIKIFNHFFLKFGRGRMVMDITVTYKNNDDYYRKAMGRTWKIPSKFLEGNDTLNYHGHSIKIPCHIEDYLTFLYGDWKKPDQNYDPLTTDKSLSRKGLI